MRMMVNLAPKEMPSGKVREPLVEMPRANNERSVERKPKGFWKVRKNRVEAIRRMVAESGMKPQDITADYFSWHKISGVLAYYRSCPYEALRDAGFKIRPWERAVTPGRYYYERKNRIAAIRRLVKKLEKAAREITQYDFWVNRLTGVLSHYNQSPYEALKDAGLVSEADEVHMRSSHHTHKGETGNGKRETGN